MKNNNLHLFCAFLLTAAAGGAQTLFNATPTRVLGQPRPNVATVSPNYIEGRELATPQGIALDTTVSPPILYVADTGNNRILAWRDATTGGNGVKADKVIGQRDFFSTLPQGSGTNSGLNNPTGLLVDSHGHLWVVDSGDNRILRYPRPFEQTEGIAVPDLVVGQKDFSTRAINQGLAAPNETTLAFMTGTTPLRGGIAFDPAGNLWVADTANNRVLRFPVARLDANGAAADLVFGQADFNSRVALGITAANRTNKTGLNFPAYIIVDSASRVYATDRLGRAVVWNPPYTTNTPASRVVGVSGTAGISAGSIGVSPTGSLAAGEGMFFIDGNLAVVDAAAHRILKFPPYTSWPAETPQQPSPVADVVIGQANFTSGESNRGGKEAVANGFYAPIAAAPSSGGTELYVVDALNHRAIRLGGKPGYGNALQVFGQPGFTSGSPNLVEGREFHTFDAFTAISGTNAFTAPGAGVATDGVRVYVADSLNHRILGFRDVRGIKNGQQADLVIGQTDFLRTVVDAGANNPNDLGLNTPAGIAVDIGGNLWVADSGNGRVLRFPRPFDQPPGSIRANLVLGQANFNTKFTDPTSRNMSRPYGIAFTPDLNVIVSDAAHNRVLFFRKPDGDYTNGQAAEKVFGQPDFNSSTGSNSAPQRLISPAGVSVDGANRLYVADTGRARVAIFDAGATTQDPTPIFLIDTAPQTNSPMNSPHAVYVSPFNGEIWVADSRGGTGSLGRILRYPRYDLLVQNPAPEFILPTAGRYPFSVALDQFGNLVATDGSNRTLFYYPGLAVRQAANFYLLTQRALAPNTYASVGTFGPPFSDQTAVFDRVPMNTTLADTQVLLNEQPVPLHFVSPSQINFYVPNGAPQTGNAELLITRESTGQVLGSGTVPLTNVAPGMFTKDNNGTGQIAAVNQDGTINSASNPAARGTFISLYGTGVGVLSGSPADGDVPSGPVNVSYPTRVFMGAGFVPDENIQYSGLAGCCVGLWQVNVKIPENTAPSGTVPVQVILNNVPNYDAATGQRTTIAVKQQ